MMMQRINRKMQRTEEGSSLLSAILLMVVLSGIVASMTMLAMAATSKSGSTRNYTYYSIAADAAINRALFVANNLVDNSIRESIYSCDRSDNKRNDWFESDGAVKPASTQLPTLRTMSEKDAEGGMRYAWCTRPVPSATAGLSFDIYAWGFRDDFDDSRVRNLRARIESVPVRNTVPNDSGDGLMYQPTAEGVFAWGVLGTSALDLKGNAAVRSYNSGQTYNPTTDTGEGSIATNFDLNYTPESVFGRIGMLNVSDNTDSHTRNRCFGDRCAAPYLKEYAYGIDLSNLDQDIAAKCPPSGGPYPNWTASANGGVYNPPRPGASSNYYACYNNMVFDTNTSLGNRFFTGLPAYAYLTGNIVVNPGVQVNTGGVNGGPLSLRIYSSGGQATFHHSTTSNPTRFAGLVAGNQLTCSDGIESANVVPQKKLLYYGGLSCAVTTIGGGTEVWWDVQTSQILNNNESGGIRLWNITQYDEIFG